MCTCMSMCVCEHGCVHVCVCVCVILYTRTTDQSIEQYIQEQLQVSFERPLPKSLCNDRKLHSTGEEKSVPMQLRPSLHSDME